MKIELKKESGRLTAVIEGNIDTVTAPALESELKANWAEISNLTLDFTGVNYISSAGLRVLIIADKYMAQINGSMSIKNANGDVMEVFEMTGFDEILKFE